MIRSVRQALRAVSGINLPVLVFLLAANMLHARTLYLAPDGDDSADCVAGAEFKTLKRSLSCLIAGDTLMIRNGSYSGGVYVYNLYGTEDSPVVIMGESLESVIEGSENERDGLRIENSAHVVLEGFSVMRSGRAGLCVRMSHHVRVTGCRMGENEKWGILTSFADDMIFEKNECFGSVVEHGIYHANSSDRFIIRGNRVHHNRGNGIHMNGDPDMGGDGVLSQGLVEDNIIYGNGISGGAAINMTHVQDVIVRNNLIYGNEAAGITFYDYIETATPEQQCKRAVILNNTIVFMPRKGRACVNIQVTAQKVLMAGNILVGGGNRGVVEMHTEYLATVVADHNLYWGACDNRWVDRGSEQMDWQRWRSLSGQDAGSLVADPLFALTDTADFTLQDTSAAVDLGLPADSVLATLRAMEGFEWALEQLESLPQRDIRGAPRPVGAAPDAGAYEHGDWPTSYYDFNRDGKLSMVDAIELILRGIRTPEDPALDVNGDGGYTISDVIQLLIIMRQA